MPQHEKITAALSHGPPIFQGLAGIHAKAARDTVKVVLVIDVERRASVATNVISGALPAISTPRALFGLFPVTLREKACALIADAGLGEEHRPRRVSALSGRQQQRVGIARAFMLDPAFILADEPVASLDPQTSVDILTLLAREAKDRAATVLCSLHQIDLALRFADRIVALRDGRIEFDDPPDALAQQRLGRIYESRPDTVTQFSRAVGA